MQFLYKDPRPTWTWTADTMSTIMHGLQALRTGTSELSNITFTTLLYNLTVIKKGKKNLKYEDFSEHGVQINS